MNTKVLPHMVSNIPLKKRETKLSAANQTNSDMPNIDELVKRLEAKMPEQPSKISMQDIVSGISFLVIALVVASIYIGIPFFLVANAFLNNVTAELVFTVTIIISVALIVGGSLLGTTQDQEISKSDSRSIELNIDVDYSFSDDSLVLEGENV